MRSRLRIKIRSGSPPRRPPPPQGTRLRRAPGCAGHLAAQGTAFKCRVPNCGNQDCHFLPECLVFRAMSVSERWTLVKNQNFCKLCLKHFKSGASSCNLAKAAGGPPPCGESGCTAFHHPALHVQRTGWSSSHGTAYTFVKEDSEEPDVVSISDNSEEPVEEPIKQGAGDMRACGPSTFINVDSFKTNGEVVSIAALCRAVVNTHEKFDIAINKNVENAENDTENVNKIDQIDLRSKNIESSTGIISVPAEIMPEPFAIAETVTVADPIAVVKPIDVADPFTTGRVLTEINSQNQTTINLCQTISCNSTPLNVLFDSGATMT
jgi:hypothetical protein